MGCRLRGALSEMIGYADERSDHKSNGYQEHNQDEANIITEAGDDIPRNQPG